LTPGNSHHFSDIDYLIAGFAATGLILLYLFFSSSPHVSFGILHSWFAYYILFFSALSLVAGYKLGMQSRSSKHLALGVVILGLFSICAFFLIIGCIGFFPLNTMPTTKVTPVISNPSFGAILFGPFYFMDWVQSPLAKLVGIALIYFSLKALKVIKMSLKDQNS